MSHYVPNTPETMVLGAVTSWSMCLRVKTADNIGIAVRTTGTATGTWGVLYSNDYVSDADDVANSYARWDTYTLSTTPPAAAGAAQVFGIVIDAYEFAFVRVIFTGSAGAGVATITSQMKGN